MRLKYPKEAAFSVTLHSTKTIKQIFSLIFLVNVALAAPEVLRLTKDNKTISDIRMYVNGAVVVLSIFGFKPANQIDKERLLVGDLSTPAGQEGPNKARTIFIPETEEEEKILLGQFYGKNPTEKIINNPILPVLELEEVIEDLPSKDSGPPSSRFMFWK